MRTHRAGDVRPEMVGDTVTVCGWVAARRDHGGVVFVDVRDAAGIVQVVLDPAVTPEAHDLRSEYCIAVEGEVRNRPEGTVNPDLDTGEVEVAAASVTVLNPSEPPPIPIGGEADEVLRLRYRYLDLRSERLQRNLRIRAQVNTAIRTSLAAQEFTEVETPMLVASTPEGARDFIVPARLAPGSFYALPQSPQLFKQLLMVGGLDRYYQIARCLRDEDLRADRQFEFMQLDAEMSFADGDDVRAVISEAVRAAAEAITGEPVPEIPTMTWHHATECYGSDKPDLRFGLELHDLSEVFAATEFRGFQADAVKGIRVPAGGSMSRSQRDALVDRAKELGAAGLVWVIVGEHGALESPVVRFWTEQEQLGLCDAMGGEAGDLLLIVAGARRMTNHVLGTIRNDLGRPPVHEGGLHFVWVVDFPLFEAISDDGTVHPAHHPFTAPHPDDLQLLAHAKGEELLSVRSQSYDLVLNGWELGSGSVRIHRADLQQEIFTILGIDEATARARFGFLLDAFRFGAPPHAGFAFGIDRLVAILAGEDNIREVIAYPKTQSGADPLTGAPTPVDDLQLRELGIALRKPPAAKAELPAGEGG
jgi:aspartyl-tRNA synthetase